VSGRIDTHSHVVPPFYAEWLRTKGALAGGARDCAFRDPSGNLVRIAQA
jgi:hypothetical protein